MSWTPIVRREARFDFEDWRYIEDRRPDAHLNWDEREYTLSALDGSGDGPAHNHFLSFWNTVEELFSIYESDDDVGAQLVDDVWRGIARSGNPEAALMLARARLSLGALDEGARWLSRALHLTSGHWSLDLPEGEAQSDYKAYVRDAAEPVVQLFEQQTGNSFNLLSADGLFLGASDIACKKCGVQIRPDVRLANDGFIQPYVHNNELLEACPGFFTHGPRFINRVSSTWWLYSKFHLVGESYEPFLERWPNAFDESISGITAKFF